MADGDTLTDTAPAAEAGADDAGGAAPQFVYYNPHPILGLFPEPTEGELAAMEVDVAAEGIRSQIVLWTDPRNRTFLIDGRTRQTAASRAFQKKVEANEPPLAANGEPLQPPVYHFTGDLDAVYRFVQGTHIRKHYQPGQRAAMGVMQHYYELKQKTGGRLPTLENEMKRPDAVDAKTLAVRFNCNEYYIRICRRLYREAFDLLQSVAAGVIPPQKAEAQLNTREAGPVEDDGGAAGDAGPAPPGQPDAVLDANKQPVPEQLEEKFKARAGFAVVVNHLEDARRAATKLAALPGGEWLDLEAFDRVVGAAVKSAKNTQPHTPCADCDGRGHPKGQRWKCKRCEGRGYVCRAVLVAEQAAAKAKKKAEAAPAEAAAE